MHGALRASQSLAIQFATFAHDVETFDLIIEIEQAKRKMRDGKGDGVYIMGFWWMEG